MIAVLALLAGVLSYVTIIKGRTKPQSIVVVAPNNERGNFTTTQAGDPILSRLKTITLSYTANGSSQIFAHCIIDPNHSSQLLWCESPEGGYEVDIHRQTQDYALLGTSGPSYDGFYVADLKTYKVSHFPGSQFAQFLYGRLSDSFSSLTYQNNNNWLFLSNIDDSYSAADPQIAGNVAQIYSLDTGKVIAEWKPSSKAAIVKTQWLVDDWYFPKDIILEVSYFKATNYDSTGRGGWVPPTGFLYAELYRPSSTLDQSGKIVDVKFIKVTR